jgi:TRAP-type C4-dicarboxylate transport system substrate-binding protein
MACGALIFASCDKRPGSASKASTLTFTVAHNQTSMENPYAFGANKFKEVLERLSGGTINVIVHHGTLGENESELIEKLEMGAIDFALSSPGFMTAIGVSEVDMLSLLYLFDSFDHWEAAIDGDFGNTMKAIIEEKTQNHFRVLDFWTSSVRDYYGKKPVVRPADLKGMTLRTQSAQVVQDFWKACGVIPASVAWGELYQALQQGVVDSAENDYTSFMLKEHHKTMNGKYVSETHHDYTTRLFLTSGAAWNKLTDEQKQWVTEASREAARENRQVTYRMFEESKKKVIADGALVIDFNDVDVPAFRAIAIPIQENFAEKNNLTRLLTMVREAQK